MTGKELQTLLKNTKHVKCGCDFDLDGRTRGPWPLGTVNPHPKFAFSPLSLYMEPISFLPLVLPKDHFILYKKNFITDYDLNHLFTAVVVT